MSVNSFWNSAIRARIFLSVLVLSIAALFLTAQATGQANPAAVGGSPSAQTSKANGPGAANALATPPTCPAGGRPATQASEQGKRHHKVTLAWNASSLSTNPESNAAGYCLYRTQKPNAAKQAPPCADCELLNSTPFAGTACVDDLVDDSTTYYYVVTAVNAKSKASDWSNEASAQIPGETQALSVPVSIPAAPSCREALVVK